MFKHQFKAGRTSKTYFYKRTLAQIKKKQSPPFFGYRFFTTKLPIYFFTALLINES